MTLSQNVRRAMDRRLEAIAASLRSIEGLAVDRQADALRVRGRRLLQRSIEDVRLRFAALAR